MKIHLEGFCQDARYLYFIMEFVPGGELLSYLRSVSRLESYHARSVFCHSACMRLRLSSSSSISTIGTSSLGISSHKTCLSLRMAILS